MRSSRAVHHRRPWRAAYLALALAIVAGLGTACGSSTKTISGPSTSTAQGAGTASDSAYVSCMEKQGLPASVATRLGVGFSGGFRPGAPTAAGAPPGGSVPAGSGPSGAPRHHFSLPAGVTQAQLQKALSACRTLRPAGRFGGARLNGAAGAAYRNCLTIHGVTVPTRPGRTTTTTPGSSSSSSTSGATASGGGGGYGGLDPSNPTVAAALKACAALRPALSGAASTTSITA